MHKLTLSCLSALLVAPLPLHAAPADKPFPVTLSGEANKDEASLQEALEAAFGVQIKAGADAKTTARYKDESYTFRPVGLYRIGGDLWALLSSGSSENDGHAASGTNAIHYLRAAEGGWQRVGGWFGLGSTGTWGNGATEWGYTRALGRNPYILTAGGGTWQGCTVSVAVLTELTPQGPRDRGSFTEHNSWNEETMNKDFSYDGAITAAVPDKSFTVTYKGSRAARQIFVRKGAKYEPVGKEIVPGC